MTAETTSPIPLDLPGLLGQMARALATREVTVAWLETISDAELEGVWMACPDARALFRLAAPAMKPEPLVRVACACLRFALDEKAGFHRIRHAAKVLDQWASGAATWAAFEEAHAKVDEAEHAEDLARALAAAAATPKDRLRAQDVAAALALALSNDDTVYAAGTAAPPTKTRVGALAQLADVVRKAMPCPSRAALISGSGL